jgi:hypothetical protein
MGGTFALRQAAPAGVVVAVRVPLAIPGSTRQTGDDPPRLPS